MVSGSISLRYSRFFSPFLHSTGSLSVSQEYLALPDGAGKFKRGVSDPALLRIPPLIDHLPLRGYHPLWPTFPDHSSSDQLNYVVLQPLHSRNYTGLGSCAFARHYLRNHFFVFSSSRYLDVSVPWVCSYTLRCGLVPSAPRVAPFGYLRITSYLRFPVAFRSLSRPSSPLRA